MSLIRFALVAALAATASAAGAAEHWVFLTDNPNGGKGIYRCLLDDKTGKMTEPQLAAELASPVSVAVHPTGKFLYAVGAGAGKDGGPVVAYALDPKSGSLTKLNQHLSGGAGPCHVAVHPNGRYLIVANDGGANTVVFRLDEGKVGERAGSVAHTGKGVVKGPQDRPHPRCALFDPTGKKALTADLGLDKIKVFAFDADKGTLNDEGEKDVTAPPGSGPRYLVAARDGEFVYFTGELDSTVNVVRFGSGGGGTIQSLSTLPSPTRENAAGECLLSPNGRFVYVLNHGNDSVAVFKVGADGKLAAAGHITGGIKAPGGFALDPSGKWLFVAGRANGRAGIWELDPTTSAGKDTGQTVPLDRCGCVRFAPVEKVP